MLNSISMIPGSEDEVPSSADGMSWGATTSVNGTPARGNSPRTFLMKASRFFAELKRRKVYKVAVAYAFGSWLLIQAASIFLPAFDAPPCMMKAVVVFLALGFIVSAILSWVFDITPQGIKRTADISPDQALPGLAVLLPALVLKLDVLDRNRVRPGVQVGQRLVF